MALNMRDSVALGTRPVSSRKAMSPRLTLPRISPGRSLPRTTMRSTVDQARSERIALRAISVGLDVGFANYFGPAVHFALEECAEVLGRTRHDLDAHLAEALPDLG